MKLLLINPNSAFQKYPPLSLAIIASLTPSDWEVEILDLNFTPLSIKKADLVGITSFTCTAPMAYEIAKLYRKNNMKVVMGGIHASILPDEALNYVDSVVIGEAEGIWNKVIEDFVKGELKQTYKAELLPYENWPIPRHDLLHPYYQMGAIQTSRGCPFNCDFCSVSLFNGNQYRLRPIDEVIAELKTIKAKRLFILDDNILGVGKKNEERALELFRRIKEEKINKPWFSFASVNFADKPEIIKAAAESGCEMIFIGFEAEDDEQLKEMNKGLNVKSGSHLYSEAVKKINKHKIAVMGGFIIGFDTDTKESIDRRLKFMLRHRINSMSVAYLTPLPGTKSYNNLVKENRIIKNDYPKDWSKYNFLNVLYQPKNMTPEELAEKYFDIIVALYKRKNILMRALVTFIQTRSYKITKNSYRLNMRTYLSYKRAYDKYLKNNPNARKI
ncbi:MAG: B12-binding domain-containing radical SAM protein [Bacteroidia bacterium]|nr:B12-binding domain-containing radical SAM protein [Bacteroidia bacterium]